MTTITEMENANEIKEQEFSQMTKVLFNSFLVKNPTTDKTLLDKKGELISLFADLLNKYIELQFPNDRTQKLQMINFIDKVNLQKEFIDLKKGVTNIKDIKSAANRLGRKSQSAFKTK